jgi:hypothetical protein
MGNLFDYCKCKQDCQQDGSSQKFCSCQYNGPNAHKCRGNIVKAKKRLEQVFKYPGLSEQETVDSLNQIIDHFCTTLDDTAKMKIQESGALFYSKNEWCNHLGQHKGILVYETLLY